MDTNPIITVRHLNVTYFPGKSNEVHALKDINLEIFPGEYIIFFGPSGCGKSTLLYSLAGLERKIEGDIIVHDQNLRTLGQRELENYYQRTIGMVFQSYHLIPSLSVEENVALPQVALHSSRAERLQKAKGLLEKFGVGAQGRKLPMELSGGQQQRVAICRSLMNDPDVIVADEPVGNLDSVSSEEVMNLLRSLNDTMKKTIILVTHDPSHLHHAHRIFYLRDGVITGTKKNSESERKKSPVTSMVTSLHSSLRHWARTFLMENAGSEQDQSVMQRAEELIADVFAGMTLEEMGMLAERIIPLFTTEHHDVDALIRILHASPKEGGLGMNLQRAEKISAQIKKLTSEMWILHRLEENKKDPAAERKDIRRMILDEENIALDGYESVRRLDGIIARLLHRHITPQQAMTMLTEPAQLGGVGMDPRSARKVLRRLEFFAQTSPDTPASETGESPTPLPPVEQ